jgi:biopolymer transport protein ExbD
MRIPAAGRAGIILTIAGVLAFSLENHWFSTRTFVPWDRSVKLDRNQNLQATFDVNLQQWYWVEIKLDQSRLPSYAECPVDSALQTRWTLAENGKTIAPSDEEAGSLVRGTRSGTFIGEFWGERGRYDLKAVVTSDARCLNVANPRLSVAMDDRNYSNYLDVYSLIVCLALLAAGAGIVLVLRSTAPLWMPERATGSIVPFPPANEMDRGRLRVESIWARRCARLRIAERDRGGYSQVIWLTPGPQGALLCAGLVLPLALFVILAPCWLLTSARQRSVGLPARLLGPKTVFTTEWGEALVVRIDMHDQWYLNSQPTTPEELPSVLRSRLGRSPSWVVYFNGDSTITFVEAMRAIDIIRAEHGQVILLTTPSAENPRKVERKAR